MRIHQMHALRERRYINGEFGDHLRYVCYFLAPASRKAYLAGHCDLVPNHFSEVPDILQKQHEVLVGGGGSIAAQPARLLLARHEL